MNPMRTIISKRIKFKRRPRTWKGWYAPRVPSRRFDVFLSCQHVIEVPFGRRPQLGKKMRCKECGS